MLCGLFNPIGMNANETYVHTSTIYLMEEKTMNKMKFFAIFAAGSLGGASVVQLLAMFTTYLYAVLSVQVMSLFIWLVAIYGDDEK